MTDNRTNEQAIRDSIARDIWNDEQECKEVFYKAEIGSMAQLHLGGKLAGLQRARDITQGVLVRELDEAKLAEVIDQAEKSTLTGSKPGRQRVIARAVAAYLRDES